MFRMLPLILGLGLFFSVQDIFGQQGDFIVGQLMDRQTQAPIPFASIQVKSKAIGLVSNSDGGFKIPSDYKKIGDTLLISCIGYTSKEVVLSNLFENRMNTIFLDENIAQLKEVVVSTSKKRKRLTAAEIVRLAIRKIPENYPSEPFSYIGYYRDYQVKGENYLNLNEAILGIYDYGFETEDFKSTKTRLYRYEENQHFDRDSIAARTYDYLKRGKIIPDATISGRIRNEYTRLRLHDAIRNNSIYTYSFVDRLDIDLVKNHRFQLEADTFFDDTPLFNIKITKDSGTIKVLGNIYIDKRHYGIYKLEYAVYKNKPSVYKREPFSHTGTLTAQKGKLGKLLYDISVEYQRHDGKMYLNYISFRNAFDILLPPKFAPVSAAIDYDNKRFKLILNNTISGNDALNAKNYNLYYQDRKLGIAKIEVQRKSVFLYPKNPKAVFDKELFNYFKEKNQTGVGIEIKKVKDVYGNTVNESDRINYNQFREFFVQRRSTTTKVPNDTLFIAKASPLSENQPIGPIANLSDFWMNTPLKK